MLHLSSHQNKQTMMKNSLLLISLLLIITACKNNEQTSLSFHELAVLKQDSLQKRNKQIALECIRAFERGDVDYIISHHAKDFVNYTNRPMHGIDSTTIALRQGRNMLKQYKSSNELALADNNYVFVYQNVDVSLKTDSTGKTHHAKAVEIFKFNEEGKIIVHAFLSEELPPNGEDYFAREQIH